MKPKLETIYFLGKMVEVLQSVNFVLLKLSSHQVQVYSLFKLTTLLKLLFILILFLGFVYIALDERYFCWS